MERNKAVSILYQTGLILSVVAMPFSNLGMSIAAFFLLGTWLIDQVTTEAKTRKYRWSKAIRNPLLWILTGLFFIHVFGLLYTQDWAYGLNDLRKKLPLLLFPVVFFTAQPMEGRALRRMLLFFVLANGAAALYCWLIPLGIVDHEVKNVRDISVFISHIRFSMLLVLASAVLMHWLAQRRFVILSIFLLLINISFLWRIESLTGVFLLITVVVLFLISEEASILGRSMRRFLRVTIFLGLIASGSWLAFEAHAYFALPEDFDKPLETHTSLGNPYLHHPENTLQENGHFLWRYIANEELDSAWSKRSQLKLSDTDARGHEVYGTLLRYMTSKGLRKDAKGMQALNEEDIRRVESGVSSVLEMEHTGLRRRLDKLFFEIDLMRNGGNPSGSSVTQRLEFWRAAWHIIAHNPLAGVGTGDVQKAMDGAYIDIDSSLYQDYRLRAHNQYLTFWVAFGIFGVLLLLSTLFLPLGVPASERGFLFTAYLLIVALSYLTEDTLETQAGVTFVAFFAALFAAQRLAFHARTRPTT